MSDLEDKASENKESLVLNLSIEPEQRSSIIIDKEFDETRADSLFKEFYKDVDPKDEETRLYYFTEPHIGTMKKMGLFGDFAPSIIFSANKNNELHLPYRESNLIEFAYSKLCHLYCTLDKSIMFNYYNKHTAKSKVRNLNSVATIMGRPELSLGIEEFDEEDVAPEVIVKKLFHVKKNATKLLKDVTPEQVEWITKSEKSHNLKYPTWLEEKFSSNLSTIMLYGSSAKGEGKDFDNIVSLKTLPDNLYEKINGSKPLEGEKEVGIIFVPEYVLKEFFYINVSNTLFRDHAKVLKGEVQLPIETKRYANYKELYHAGFGSGKLISGMNLAYRLPEVFFDKPGLFEYFMKLNRFTYHGLLQQREYCIINKEDLLQRLKEEFDFKIPPFKADKAYIQESFLKANKASVKLAEKLYDDQRARTPNEVLIVAEEQVSARIFRTRHEGKQAYIFSGMKEINQGDAVPVSIIQEDDQGYKNRVRELIYHEIIPRDFSEKILIGKRV